MARIRRGDSRTCWGCCRGHWVYVRGQIHAVQNREGTQRLPVECGAPGSPWVAGNDYSRTFSQPTAAQGRKTMSFQGTIR